MDDEKCCQYPVLPVFSANFQLAYAEVVAGNKQLTTLVLATLSHGRHLQRFQRVWVKEKIQKTDICDAGIVVSSSLDFVGTGPCGVKILAGFGLIFEI